MGTLTNFKQSLASTCLVSIDLHFNDMQLLILSGCALGELAVYIDELRNQLFRVQLVIAQDYEELQESAPYMFSQILGQPVLSYPSSTEDLAKSSAMISVKEIPRHWIKLTNAIGKGAFGQVYRAVLKSDVTAPEYFVAVKLPLDATNTRKHNSTLLQEAMVMVGLTHPHIVHLIGAVTKGDPMMVIVEYCEIGSLSRFLRNSEVEYPRQACLAADIASGMAYLHSKGVIHRDLAARNVLLSSEFRAKVCDYGLSRVLGGKDYYRSRGGVNSVRWTAPEALEGQLYSEASDVWSFGVVMYEIWSKGLVPYGDKPERSVWSEVCKGLRLTSPVNCPALVYKIMRLCWRVVAERPRFLTLTEKLRRIEIGLLQRELQVQLAGGASDAQGEDPGANEPVVDGQYMEPTMSLEVAIPLELTSKGEPSCDDDPDAARFTDI